jgi:probable rRNA maturation factor
MRGAGHSEVSVSGAAEGVARLVRASASAVLRQERRRARLTITLVGKRKMRSLNAEHLGHDYPTDVISFPLPQPDGTMAGDIYLCRYIAARNARVRGVPVREEVIRLAVHGTLHVLGWDHPDGAARMRSPMWRRQERYVTDLR